MAASNWEVVVDGLGRLEAPCFDLDTRLCFTDIAEPGAIYRLERSGAAQRVLRGRPHTGGLVAHRDGGLVAAGPTVAVVGCGPDPADPAGRVLLDPQDGWGFNDLTTDPDGNVFVGMHGERPSATLPRRPGSLWRIGTDGSVRRCYGSLTLTNGLGVSPDGSLLYHADSLARLLWVSAVGRDGELGERRVFFVLPSGMPDGIAVDESGGVWIAAIGEGTVLRVDPEGKLDCVVEVPMRFVSAVRFGGGDGRDLYVTTFGAPYEEGRTGSVLRTRVPFGGAPVTPAAV